MMSRTILPNFLRDFLSETTFSPSEKETNTFSSCCSRNNLATIRASFQFRNHHEKTFVDTAWRGLSKCLVVKSAIVELSTESDERGRRGGQRQTLPHFSSVQFSCSVVSDSLQPHELQHARPPCPTPTPGVHSDSRPSSQ